MISQAIPISDIPVNVFRPEDLFASAWRADEPLRVELHVAARRQGTSFDPCTVSCGTRAGRLRWALLLSDTRPDSARRGRQRAARGNFETDRVPRALLGDAGTVSGRALRH